MRQEERDIEGKQRNKVRWFNCAALYLYRCAPATSTQQRDPDAGTTTPGILEQDGFVHVMAESIACHKNISRRCYGI
jgi:hypothetical protein